jgi:hypothetical protein
MMTSRSLSNLLVLIQGCGLAYLCRVMKETRIHISAEQDGVGHSHGFFALGELKGVI